MVQPVSWSSLDIYACKRLEVGRLDTLSLTSKAVQALLSARYSSSHHLAHHDILNYQFRCLAMGPEWNAFAGFVVFWILQHIPLVVRIFVTDQTPSLES